MLELCQWNLHIFEIPDRVQEEITILTRESCSRYYVHLGRPIILQEKRNMLHLTVHQYIHTYVYTHTYSSCSFVHFQASQRGTMAVTMPVVSNFGSAPNSTQADTAPFFFFRNVVKEAIGQPDMYRVTHFLFYHFIFKNVILCSLAQNHPSSFHD